MSVALATSMPAFVLRPTAAEIVHFPGWSTPRSTHVVPTVMESPITRTRFGAGSQAVTPRLTAPRRHAATTAIARSRTRLPSTSPHHRSTRGRSADDPVVAGGDALGGEALRLLLLV